jgi:hypothetical protein
MSMTRFIPRPARLLGVGVCLFGALSSGGCVVGALIGGMAQSYKETASHSVEAEYLGLQDKSFAVVVAADRSIEADFPGLVAEITRRIDERLAANANASGHVPHVDVLGYIYNNPGWAAKTREELAEALGNPQRIVFLDFNEFRLNDPGNGYLWDGLAAGTIGVYELDGVLPEEFAFERAIRVKFPDKTGQGPTDFSRDQVVGVLLKRFIDRTTWLFYTHEEKITPDY